jgi:hypothetical protein
MNARYKGHCAWCDEPIQIGEVIHRVSNRWIHEACPTRHQPDPVKDIGACCTCKETTLLVHYWGKFGYCRDCWNDLAERMQEDYGHIHDIYDVPF